MTIDYYVDFPCAVRKQVSNEDLLRMEKARNRANMVLQLMRAQDIKRELPESEWTFMVNVMRPEGPRQMEMKIGDVLAEAQPLNALAAHCQGCPANLRRVDFGCGGGIRYPIARATEAWLLSRLPEDIDSPAGQLLLETLKEVKLDGKAIDASRQRKELYESITPVKRSWGKWLSKKTVSSSQVLQMLITMGHLRAPMAKMAAYFMGYVDDRKLPTLSTQNNPAPGDTAGVAEFKQFFTAAAFAGHNEVTLFVDA